MRPRIHAYRLFTWLVLLSLLTTTLPPLTSPPAYAEETPTTPDSGLYRTRVVVDSPSRRARLESLGIVVLNEDAGSAMVLADDDQLEALARLRFQPRTNDELGSLLQTQDMAQAWLTRSLQPLLQQGIALHNLLATNAETATIDTARHELRGALAAMRVEQRAGLATLVSPDEDLDGLTNTEEAWWCTDFQNPNSDGDAQGYTDGQEVDALLDFTLPRNIRWGYGSPFGPPNAWPNFNDRLGTHVDVCNDGDYDTIPDYAEVFMVGSRVPNETTDGDKFDDGQELFGVTYCPGAPTNCGYGSFPAIEYWNYIKANMPNWVRPPGDNIFVAAFPVPEVSVVPGSWMVNRVTTITTTQGQMTQTTNSYETSVMQGQSTSIADTVSWNNWEEVSQAIERPIGEIGFRTGAQFAGVHNPNFNWGSFLGGTALLAGGGAATAAIGVGAIGATAGSAVIGTTALTLGLATCAVTIVCAVGVGAAAAVAIGVGGILVANAFNSDTPKNAIQTQAHAGKYTGDPTMLGLSSSPGAQATANLTQNSGQAGQPYSLDGLQYAMNSQGQLIANALYGVQIALSQPRFTETHTNGHSWGGAQTTTHEVYEEHTITQGQAFTTGENWSTAWAVDSSHSADLTFTYEIKNTGTEYARELTGVIFNIYLGDDKAPIISYPAWQQFPNGKLENLFPADPPHQFASNPVPLTLDQMKRIDLGEPLRVVLEDFSYGADELFYQDAVNGGMTVFIEDGVDDGDEWVDSYVIPTWGVESVQDVLTRYFPAGYDLDGNLSSLWTPEFNGINPPAWHEHFLSDIAWWNIYLTQEDAGNTPLKDLPAEAGGAILFRFNRDSDRDGYQDRVELRYGTDKDDPADHPQPEILAGYVKEQTGDVVTVKLVLENSGTFDAYGIDAVMYSPDDTTTIGNNTVGGNGKVRPGQHVAVGSLVKPPGLGQWGNSTAKPYSAGNYSGSTDRTYTFSAATPGVVGTGSTTLNWNDGTGNTGSLPVGASYHSPLPVSVSNGLEVGLTTGTIAAGASFTVTALTPRDTFTYTVDGPNYTEPVIVVSYSDPQGSHRFITPVELPSLDSDLAPYAGQMLQPLGLEIAATGPVDTTNNNTTNLIVNNPHSANIEDGHLYVDIVADGTPVLHQEHTLPTFPPGPTVFPVIWATSAFTQTYDPAADNILLAHWTDSEGNIIDSAARLLNTFASDPTPTLAMAIADETWDFGTVAQGAAISDTFTLANTGARALLTYLGAPAGLSVSQTGSRSIAPGDMTTYVVTLDTTGLSAGAYDQTIALRTSDPAAPARTVHVVGVISTSAPGTRPVTQHPLDLELAVPGNHMAHEWIEFTHALGADPQTLHPVKVFGRDGTLQGVGRYATAFGQGTVSYDMFGDGRDGDLLVNSGQTIFVSTVRAAIAGTASSGQSTLNFAVPTTGQVPGRIEMWPKRQWADTGLRVVVGDRLVIAGDSHGHPDLFGICYGGSSLCYDSNGIGTLAPGGWTAPGVREFSLVARIGSGSPFYVGLNFDGVVNQSGELYLGMNDCDGCFSDNVYKYGVIKFTQSIWLYHSVMPQFSPGDQLVLIQMTGSGAGQNEIGTVAAVGSGSLVLAAPLSNTYITGGTSRAQVIKVPQYRNVTVQNGGELTSTQWDGSSGGIIVLKVKEQLSVQGDGRISAFANGFRGGPEVTWSQPNAGPGYQGESYTGANPSSSTAPNGGGGGGGQNEGGGGGGFGSPGANAPGGGGTNGIGGGTYGSANLSTFLGSGGGGSGHSLHFAAQGGRGGGGILIFARNTNIVGTLDANGQGGWQGNYGGENWAPVAPYESTRDGGGGSGGSIKIVGANLSISANRVTAVGGPGGKSVDNAGNGGDGGVGRVRVEYCEALSGTTNPPASTQQLDCYIVEQIESNPTHARLNLPDSFTVGRGYRIQYGRRLAYASAGEQLTSVRVSSGAFSSAKIDALLTVTGGGSTTFRVDIGNNGTWDWDTTQTINGATTLQSSDLASAFNAYWNSIGSPLSGNIDVPVRVYLSTAGQVLLTNLIMTPAPPDATLDAGDIAFSRTDPTETDPVTVNATIHNPSSHDTGGLTVGFYATRLPGLPLQIGADYVPNIPANGTATASIVWDTTGFTGTVPVRVVIDPYNRVAETNETNNEATADLTILTRPDLQTTQLALSNPGPVTDETIDVTISVHNAGQTTAGEQVVALYDGNPDAGGTLVEAQNLAALAGGATVDVIFPWAPTIAGPHRLFVRLDRDNQANESDEANNDTWQDVYIGFRGPHLIDSGSITADPPYSTTLGYGYLNGDASTFCGTRPDLSQRSASDGIVRYRFDHLLPGHYYHLDITLFECDGAGRVEVLRVDDNQIGGAVDLTDGVVHRVSTLLDPAFYTDNSITVGISETIGYDAVVARVNLHDVDYRYSDAGRSNNPADPNDPAYPYTPSGQPARRYGYLDGVDNRPWGTLPYQSRRIDLADSNPLDDPDNELRYQFDGLDTGKRYRLNLTFFQNAGGASIQTVYADDFDTGVTVTLNGQQRVDRTAEIPASAYAGDGSTVIRIVRTNALANAFVNVLALEEITSLCDAPDLSCDGQVTVADIILAAQGWNAGEMTIVDVQRVAASFQP